MAKPPSLSQSKTAVERFNAENEIGSTVTVHKDNGSTVVTVTASRAYLLGGHTPVVHLMGISGSYALDRVRPGKPEVLAERVA